MPKKQEKKTDIAKIILLDQIVIKTMAKKFPLNVMIKKLKDLLSNCWGKASRNAIIQAISTIESGSWLLTEEEVQIILDDLGKTLGMPITAAIERPIVRLNRASYIAGANDTGLQGVKFAWGLKDELALRVLNEDLIFWTGSYYDDFLGEELKGRLKKYFEGGLGRRDLALRFRADLEETLRRGYAYWDLLADHTTTKIREIGRLAGYEQAGVNVIRVKAHLDGRTTQLCRRLHGHVIAVSDLRRSVDSYLEACKNQNKEKIKETWPWWSDDEAEKKLRFNGDINTYVKRGEIGLPPYHARCRTRTVAEFVADPGDHIISSEDEKLGAIGEPT